MTSLLSVGQSKLLTNHKFQLTSEVTWQSETRSYERNVKEWIQCHVFISSLRIAWNLYLNTKRQSGYDSVLKSGYDSVLNTRLHYLPSQAFCYGSTPGRVYLGMRNYLPRCEGRISYTGTTEALVCAGGKRTLNLSPTRGERTRGLAFFQDVCKGTKNPIVFLADQTNNKDMEIFLTRHSKKKGQTCS